MTPAEQPLVEGDILAVKGATINDYATPGSTDAPCMSPLALFESCSRALVCYMWPSVSLSLSLSLSLCVCPDTIARSLCTSFSTTISLHPTVPEALVLREWWDATGKETKVDNVTRQLGGPHHHQNAPPKPISAIVSEKLGMNARQDGKVCSPLFRTILFFIVWQL